MTELTPHQCGERIVRLERDLHALDRVMELRFAALGQALKLQAEKDAKHFEDLNHEAARLAIADAKYLPRETYEADTKNNVTVWLSLSAIVISIIAIITTVLKS